MASKFRVLELYSGIGGMHFALEESGIDFEVVAAIDINTTANAVYHHNFCNTKLMNRCIESISLEEWNQFQFDMVLMSPPCQPFCRVGKQKDVDDVRTKSFLSLLQILPKLAKPPSFILVENVKGFDDSKSRMLLLDVLKSMNYNIQEFLLSPLQFGIPNSRLRYFLIAKKNPLQFSFETKSCIRNDIPNRAAKFLIHQKDVNSRTKPVDDQSDPQDTSLVSSAAGKKDCTVKVNQDDLSKATNTLPANKECITIESTSTASTDCNDFESRKLNGDDSLSNASDNDEQNAESLQLETPIYEKYKSICGRVEDYLEQECDDYFAEYLIPEKFYKRFWVMDIVTKSSTHCCCFTKRYAHHIDGAGSIIQMNTQANVDLKHYKQDRGIFDETMYEAVQTFKLRFFTPREISNIMCFPQSFSFPKSMSTIQCYRLLGNSLNVHVVAVLIKIMTL